MARRAVLRRGGSRPYRLGVAGTGAAVTGPEQLDADRQHGDQHDAEQDELDVGLDEGDLTQEVAQRGDAGAPQRPAQHVVDQERPVPHAAHTGDDRGERPHHRHEPGQHHRAGAVPGEEVVGPLHVLLLEQPRVRPAEQAGPTRLPNR